MPRYRVNKFQSLKDSAKSIYYEATRHHFSHEEILRQLKLRVWSHEYRKSLKRYEESELSGYVSGLADMLYTHLEWRSRLDGKLVTKDEIPPGRWPDVRPGAYVYKTWPDAIFSDSSSWLDTSPEHTVIREIAHHDANKQ